jgi:hypothetical protein
MAIHTITHTIIRTIIRTMSHQRWHPRAMGTITLIRITSIDVWH